MNVSELGMVTAGGKVVFGKYAQITNNPENDGCINAVLRESFSIMAYSPQLKAFCSRVIRLMVSIAGYPASSAIMLHALYPHVSNNCVQ